MGDVNHEPTMEEILASIKRIIAEDGEANPRPAATRARVKETPVEDAAEPDVLELTEAVEADAVVPEAVETEVTEEAPGAPIAEPVAETPRPEEPASPEEPPILSDVAAQASRQALASLSAMAPDKAEETAGGEALERVVRDMLRPMLKEWLDVHLPGIVEAIVAREVARIARTED